MYFNHRYFHYFRLGNGYSFRMAHLQNGETKGLLRVNDDHFDNTNERDTLLSYEEPAAVYTGATFVNSDDININGYLGRTMSLSDGNDDDEEEVAFDLSDARTNKNNYASVDIEES